MSSLKFSLSSQGPLIGEQSSVRWAALGAVRKEASDEATLSSLVAQSVSAALSYMYGGERESESGSQCAGPRSLPEYFLNKASKRHTT